MSEESPEYGIEQQWDDALESMQRGISWIRDNRQHLKWFQLVISPIGPKKVSINLGLFGEEDLRNQSLKAMFGGKEVTKSKTDNGISEDFTYYDNELRITFKWSVWHWKQEEERKQETVIF